jgi:hypothetical protein
MIDENTTPENATTAETSPEPMAAPATEAVPEVESATPDQTPTPAVEQLFTEPEVSDSEIDTWGLLTEKLKGYVRVRTNVGLVRIMLEAPTPEEIAALVDEIPSAGAADTGVVKKAKKGKKADKPAETDAEAIAAAKKRESELKTYAMLDAAVVKKPSGATFMDRVASTYAKMSAPSIGILFAGITNLMAGELTYDMEQDIRLAQRELAVQAL